MPKKMDLKLGQETTSVIIAKTFGFSWFSHTFQSHVVFHWIINSFSEASHGVELMAEQESSQPGLQSQLAGRPPGDAPSGLKCWWEGIPNIKIWM
jgi:hypothetical protein